MEDVPLVDRRVAAMVAEALQRPVGDAVAAVCAVPVTRLARGIAPGSPIEFANRAMLEEAFRGRRA